MSGKRIILLLDGTWNDADIGPCDTNIVRLQDLIARTLGASPDLLPRVSAREAANAQQKLVRGYAPDGRENIVFYERGVGTGFFDRFRGGVFGDGLAANVRRAYKFLSFYYEPGDQVFVFGFSRGAYTARSLVGYVGAAGLLTRENCSDAIEPTAWEFYRTAPNDRLPGTWAELGRFTHNRDGLRLDCVAVFDTVGALGVPLEPFWRANRDKYAFHDVDLSSITNVNLQALAIDEHRWPFQATVWRKPKFKQFATITEQVWFPGAHADVGGSYIPEERRSLDHPRALDDISLDWMIKRLLNHFPDFPCDREHWKEIDADWSSAPQHEPRTLIYKIYDEAFRSIANCPVTNLKWRQDDVTRDRHADPIAEMLHISALERLGATVKVEDRTTRYAPLNLISILSVLNATYGGAAGPAGAPDIRVVDWDGRELDPTYAVDQDRVRALIAPFLGPGRALRVSGKVA